MLRIKVLSLILIFSACHSKNKSIRMDGSSTVFPISEAVVEEYQKIRPIKVTIGVSGTGGGFKKLCSGRLSLAMASRKIKPRETKECLNHHIDPLEIPIAYDGIVIAVHPSNTWLSNIDTQTLKRIWEPEAQNKVKLWSQVNPNWPKNPIRLYAPGVDSGTYDYFTKAIIGKEHASRGDVTSSEDDNVIIQGISTDPNAMGFMGFGYYAENKHKLKALSVNGVTPTFESILNKSYEPLSRSLFLYVPKNQLSNPKTKDLLQYYLYQSDELIKEVGYVPLLQKSTI